MIDPAILIIAFEIGGSLFFANCGVVPKGVIFRIQEMYQPPRYADAKTWFVFCEPH